MLTSAAPARRAARVAPAMAAERGQPEDRAQGQAAQTKPAPEPLERRHPAEGRLHLGHARQPIERLDERLELVGPERRGRRDLEPGRQGVRREVVQTVPARTEEPPELGQRHGGRDVAHLRHSRQGADAGEDPVRRLRPGARGPQHDHQPEIGAPRRLGQAEREIPGQRAPGHEDGQGGEQHGGRGRGTAAPAAPERRPEEVARQARPPVGAGRPRAGVPARRAPGRARPPGSRPGTWSREAGRLRRSAPTIAVCRRVEHRRGLVGEQEPRAGRQGAGEQHPPALAGGELVREGVPHRAQADLDQGGEGAVAGLRPAGAERAQHEGQVTERRPVGKELPVLGRRRRGSGAAAPGRAPPASPPPPRPPARRPASGAPHR